MISATGRVASIRPATLAGLDRSSREIACGVARPRVAILATGDEIALPGEPIPQGGIVSSNAHALAALIRAGGGEPCILPIAPDTIEAVGAVADGLESFPRGGKPIA